MKLIEQNPFRMLGIPVNATARDLAANKSKFRLLDIGKEVALPTDLATLLPPIARTKEAVEAAERSIALPHDKVRHALFWIAQPDTPLGKLAYEHLLQGQTDSAIEKLRRCSDWQSQLCLATLCLQQGDYEAALDHIDYVLESHCEGFVHSVAGQTHTEDAAQLRHEYLAMLTQEVDAGELYTQLDDLFTPEAMLSELRSLAVDAPQRAIEKAIATAKAAGDDAETQLKAGQTLMSSTLKPLQQLQQLLGASDMRYSRTADKLANAILQCSINYFNKIDGENRTIISNALTLADYASRIAVGKMAKDHIKHNLDILKEKESNLPPAGVEGEDAAIKACILKHIILGGQTIDNAIALMKACAPHIVAIKERQTADSSIRTYYLNISTQVVNAALSAVIEEHNKTQNEANQLANSTSHLAVLNYMDTIQAMLKKAWKATLMMDKFDKEEAFRTGRYAEQRRALREMCDDMPGVNISSMQVGYSDIDLRTEDEVYRSCRTSSDYRSYITRYPNGKHRAQARQQYQRLHAEEEKKRKEKEERERKARLEREEEDRFFNACTSKKDFKEYLAKYPQGRHKYEAERKINGVGGGEPNGCLITTIAIGLIGGIVVAAAVESFWGFVVVNLFVWSAYGKYEL